MNFWAIFRWSEAMISWERRIEARFSRMTLTISVCCHLSCCRIAVQEYGIPNDSLLEALAAKGAVVTRVPVYRWALHEDIGPLR